MKILSVFLLACVSIVSYGQEVKSVSGDKKEKKPRFSGQHVEITADKKMFILRENVKIETEYLTLSADSAYVDREKQTLVAYGMKEFVFSGGETVVSETSKNIVRYKLGDRTLYIE